MLCTDLTLVKYAERVRVAKPLSCRSWHCPNCRPGRQKALLAQGYSGHPNRFITLTSNPAQGGTVYERAKALAHAWRLIVKRLKRLHGNMGIAYLAVFEKTQRGEPHLHILYRGPWLPQSWLSAAMDELTSSPIVDVRYVEDSRKAVRYVAKYVGKDPERFIGCKRYWSSRNFAEKRPPPIPIDPLPEQRWILSPNPFHVLLARWFSEGFGAVPYGQNMAVGYPIRKARL